MKQQQSNLPNGRRLFLNLKIKTEKDDEKRALQFQSTCDSSNSGVKNRKKTQGERLVGDHYDTVLEESFADLFQKGKKLGEGAHSVVYQYTEKKTRKQYAVKVFKNTDVEHIKDIRESYFIMKQLDHPFVAKPQTLYINETNSSCYLVMELCNYRDLRFYIQDQIQKGRNIPEEKAASILGNILMVLKFLKEKGVCHRDIKPENILYDPVTGNIKLIDFQLSKMKKYKDEALEMWTSTGSLYYRAPESFNVGYGETIDMWAVGIIAFQLLNGKLPFESSSAKGVTEQILKKEFNLDLYDLSGNAKKFLKELLEKDPKRRLTPSTALKSSFLLRNSSCLLSNFPKLHTKFQSQKTGVKTEGEQTDICPSDLKAMEESDVWKLAWTGEKDNEIYLIK